MPHRLRIVYMGTPDFAVYPLQRLLEEGHHVVGVVTNPDKPAGRGQKLQESAVKRFVQARGLTLLQPERFRDDAFLAQLEALRADIQLVVAFKMLPEVVWNMPPLGTVNLHASLLPDYRGAAPINRAIMNGETFSGVTTFLLKQEMDTGNIIFQQRVEVDEKMTAGELHDRLMEVGAELLLRTVNAMASGDYSLQEQRTLLKGREAKMAPKIFKEEMKIDWGREGVDIYNHIRGLSPFPTAWMELENRETKEVVSLKIFRATYERVEHQHPLALEADGGERFSIYIKGGILHLEEIQLSGKRRMDTTEFTRGFRLQEWSVRP